ncbi:MAG: cupin domain-containing protein [Geminicoccaceae bacterium]|nr:cupin domain-containing protein [Geminicoccaceae bacterium]
MWKESVGPGEGPPPHVHTREDGVFHVLEGAFTFWCDGTGTEAGPGAVVALPRGVPHRFWNSGDAPGRLLVPGGFERVFLDVEARGLDDTAAVGVLFAEYGLAFVAPPATETA